MLLQLTHKIAVWLSIPVLLLAVLICTEQAYYRHGVKLLRAGQRTEAMAALSTATKLCPCDAAAWTAHANALLGLTGDKAAYALSGNYWSNDLLANHKTSYCSAEQALADTDMALLFDNRALDAWAARIRAEQILFRAGSFDRDLYDRTLSDVKTTISLGPGDTGVRELAGDVLYHVGAPDDALTHFHAAAKLGCRDVAMFAEMEDIDRHKDDSAAVLDDINEQLRIAPSADEYRRRGFVEKDAGWFKEALRDFLQVQAMHEKVEEGDLVSCRYALGDYSAILKTPNGALAADPGSLLAAPPLMYRGLVEARLGRRAVAIEDLEATIPPGDKRIVCRANAAGVYRLAALQASRHRRKEPGSLLAALSAFGVPDSLLDPVRRLASNESRQGDNIKIDRAEYLLEANSLFKACAHRVSKDRCGVSPEFTVSIGGTGHPTSVQLSQPATDAHVWKELQSSIANVDFPPPPDGKPINLRIQCSPDCDPRCALLDNSMSVQLPSHMACPIRNRDDNGGFTIESIYVSAD